MKTAELQGALLDYWVAQAKGDTHVKLRDDMWFRPSSDWAQGGPIIEREEIMICKDGAHVWGAMCGGMWHPGDESSLEQGGYQGSTPLIAAMRAYVASKFGEEVPDTPPA